ncbi:MAG TPA: class I SAM-dependent methyltransferase [Allosphingosinicella sp.]|nr:class I SAM-dependent methyltransferase [Allosphingosinicella sp.]
MTSDPPAKGNIDPLTVDGFGREWATFDQTALDEREHERLFEAYFSTFPFETLPASAEGFDLGCGSGRWAALMAPRVAILHCIDPSAEALAVTRRRLADQPSARFHLAGADSIPLPDGSQDFGYSLGVLHHIPDTRAAMRDCVRKLKIGAPFLVYLYYDFDNKPAWFRRIWQGSDLIRRGVSRLPFGLRKGVSDVIAVSVYWPLVRFAGLAERLGADVSNFPLSAYRGNSFYTMRTDALDRFGTRLEHRFSRAEIEAMMTESGLTDIRFREDAPYWVACGRRSS